MTCPPSNPPTHRHDPVLRQLKFSWNMIVWLSVCLTCVCFWGDTGIYGHISDRKGHQDSPAAHNCLLSIPLHTDTLRSRDNTEHRLHKNTSDYNQVHTCQPRTRPDTWQHTHNNSMMSSWGFISHTDVIHVLDLLKLHTVLYITHVLI